MKDVLKKVAASARADYAEIRLEETRASRISYKGHNLEAIAESTDFGGCVRALVNGGWGFVSFNRVEDVEEKMNMAIRQAEIISKHINNPTKLAPVRVVEDRVTVRPKNDPRKVALIEKQAILAAYNDIVLGFDKRITTSSIDYFDKFSTLMMVTSEGAAIEQQKFDIGGNISAIANDGRESQFGVLGFGSSNDFGCVLGKEERVREICASAVALLDAKPVRGGEYTVVIDPMLAGVFVHEAFGHLSEGDNVYRDKDLQRLMTLGEVYGPDILNIYDSGLDEGKRGYLKYDDEGVPTEKTYLIKHGKLVGRLHSRETAGEMGEEATGSARAMNYRHAPICRMRNTCIENGETPFEDMIKDIKLGVYARKSYGGQTNGEMFTFSAGEAYMIRDGKVAELVKDCTLTGNVFQTLKNIEMVGNDFAVHDSGGGCGKGGQMPLPVSHGSPHIRIKNVVVGGK